MPRVFISYSHDSEEHQQRVWDLADQLKQEGLSIIIDRDMLPGGPAQGWDIWSWAQVVDADMVLLACTETYCRRYEVNEVPGTGLGAVCEARTIRQLLFNTGGINQKFRVISFEEDDVAHVPLDLQSYQRSCCTGRGITINFSPG